MQSWRMMWDRLAFVYEVTPHNVIRSNFEQLKPLEQEFKVQLKTVLEDPLYEEARTGEMKDTLEKYLANEQPYHVADRYNDAVLKLLMDSLNHYGVLMGQGYFIRKRRLLEKQAELLYANQRVA